MRKNETIELKPLGNRFMEVTIVGDSDARTERKMVLMYARSNR